MVVRFAIGASAGRRGHCGGRECEHQSLFAVGGAAAGRPSQRADRARALFTPGDPRPPFRRREFACATRWHCALRSRRRRRRPLLRRRQLRHLQQLQLQLQLRRRRRLRLPRRRQHQHQHPHQRRRRHPHRHRQRRRSLRSSEVTLRSLPSVSRKAVLRRWRRRRRRRRQRQRPSSRRR